MTRAGTGSTSAAGRASKDARRHAWYDLVKEGLAGRLIERVSRRRRKSVRRMESRADEARERRRAETERRPPDPCLTGRSPRRGLSGRGRSSRRRGSPWPRGTAPRRVGGAAAAWAAGPQRRTAASRAGGSCMPCCSICRRSSPEAIRNGRHAPSSRRAAQTSLRRCRRRSSQRRSPSSANPALRPCSDRGALPRCRSWRGSATARTALELKGQIDRLGRPRRQLAHPRLQDESAAAQAPSRRWRRPISTSLPPTGSRLRGCFRGGRLRAALLWTDGARLMEIPSTSLDGAEQRILQARRQP